MASLNDLPAPLQPVIQQGYLERRFRAALRAKLGFRAIADREDFPAQIGETLTKTRTGLLPQVTTPLPPAQVTDITSGLTPNSRAVEQYTLAVAQYADMLMLNVATSRVAIDDLYLDNTEKLGEQSIRSVDGLAQRALFDVYMGGNTRVITALGSPSTTLRVDDVRGFFMTMNSQNVPVPVSGSVTLAVVVGASVYTLVGCVADGAAPASLNPWMAVLSFSGSGSNVSTVPGGFSGTLTFSTNVSTTDGALSNAVQSAVAPVVLRPSSSTGSAMAATTAAISQVDDLNAGRITMQMILKAKATMATNGVPATSETGNYILYADPLHLTGLYADPDFQRFFRGRPDTPEYRQGIIAEQLGVTMVETNMNPVQMLTGVGLVRRAILCGQGALVEGVFTPDAMAEAQKITDSGLITIVDGIAHITRPPIDALQQVVTQTWAYIGGFTAPTDVTTTPNTIPTANNSAWKRAIMLESL